MRVTVCCLILPQIRAYNRLAHIARGDFLVVMADDDFPPQDCGWLTNIARIFERWCGVLAWCCMRAWCRMLACWHGVICTLGRSG